MNLGGPIGRDASGISASLSDNLPVAQLSRVNSNVNPVTQAKISKVSKRIRVFFINCRLRRVSSSRLLKDSFL